MTLASGPAEYANGPHGVSPCAVWEVKPPPAVLYRRRQRCGEFSNGSGRRPCYGVTTPRTGDALRWCL